MSAKILIVDDEDLIRWSLGEDLSKAGYKTVLATTVEEAVKALESESPDAVLTDLRLASESGIEVLKAARQMRPETPVILMTAYADLASAIEAMREGAADYISKPLQLTGLKITLQRVLETATMRTRLQQANRKRKERFNFDSIIARSVAMKEALAMAKKIASSPLGTVLILGESGCGKDRLARAIHYESPRSLQPFMEISCAAIPENLLESELFGYERGAFTGAVQQKKGLFEMANGGTVFLNEIGHMPLGLQVKLLRVIEDKTFKRVGGRDDITIDVRIMAATNEKLDIAMKENRFRSDLFYRINVLTIDLLALRQRREDILPLADALLELIAKELRKPKITLSESTRHTLLTYDWPGNVRELKNALERMVILGEDSIKPLAETARQAAAADEANASHLPESGVVLEDLERDFVRQALERTGGNQQKAAHLLGISRDSLRRRVEKFGIKIASILILTGLSLCVTTSAWAAKKDKKRASKDAFLAANQEAAATFKDKTSTHPPVKDGACLQCHNDPKDPAKLKLEYKELCFSCHSAGKDDLQRAHVHPAFKDNDCSVCHASHAADQPSLLVSPQAELCVMCHAIDDGPAVKAHFGITKMQTACTSCHSAHATDNPKLLRDSKQHVPFQSRSCEMCHKPAKLGVVQLKETPDATCFLCHSNFRALAKEPEAHPPFMAGQCTACHNPHIGRRQALTDKPLSDICLGCHDAGLKDNHPVARHPTAKEGTMDPRRKNKPFDCASCHQPHAGKLPKLLRAEPSTLCQECHNK
ncbi:MAG: sigma 54-interacting transcriptional regulator [Elusimicrobiota bacterium]